MTIWPAYFMSFYYKRQNCKKLSFQGKWSIFMWPVDSPQKSASCAGFFYLMTSSWFKFTVAAAGAATNAAAARRCLSCISQWKSAVGDRVIARKFDCSCVFWYENITRKSGATFCDDRSNRSISPGIYRHLVIRTTTGEFNVEIVEIEFDDLKQEWKGMGLLPDT